MKIRHHQHEHGNPKADVRQTPGQSQRALRNSPEKNGEALSDVLAARTITLDVANFQIIQNCQEKHWIDDAKNKHTVTLFTARVNLANL